LAHQRPYLSTEPVDTAHVGFPAQLPRVAKTRRIAVALAAALDRHDLRHQARLYTGEVAKPERIALGDRADRIDAAEDVAFVASRRLCFSIRDEPAHAPLPSGEREETVAFDVVLVEDDASVRPQIADEREV